MITHPDAAQDQAQIAETLGPVLEILLSQNQALEERLGQLEQVVIKLITGANDAVKSHKRAGLTEMIGGQFAPQIGPYSDIYKDVMGRDIAEDIVNMLESQGIEGDGIGQAVERFVKMVEGRFGKYVPKPTAVEVEVSSGPVPEEVKEEIQEESGESGPKDEFEKLLNVVNSVRKRG